MLWWAGTLTNVSLQGNYLPVAVGGYINQRITAGKLPSCCSGWVQTFCRNMVTFVHMKLEVPVVVAT
jgi:hypothetical protein